MSRIGRLRDTPAGSPVGARTIHPEWYVGQAAAQLGRPVGLTQFGVNHMTLAPGARSALRHWHEQEDEFVFVLEGQLTLIDDDGEHALIAGDYVGFPAGEANAHHLANFSDAPASYLAVGTRYVGVETVHYPDDPEMGVQTGERGASGCARDAENLSATVFRDRSIHRKSPLLTAPKLWRRAGRSDCRQSFSKRSQRSRVETRADGRRHITECNASRGRFKRGRRVSPL
ncbi:MAG TPA: cupin domain-containing protein [Caulobacteraceae bacterium]